MTRTSYLVPARAATAETEVKRSRFLAHVVPVGTESEARAVVDEARRTHWDAGHHCSAFILGADGATARSSDDGEPSGTAGAPMLEVLRGADLSDVVAVVSRWFGGTLLGAGGLVRAYGDAVREALDLAGTRERRLLQEFTVEVGHGEAGRLESDLRAHGVEVVDAVYAAAVTLRVAVPAHEAAQFGERVASLSAGSVVAVPAGQRWV